MSHLAPAVSAHTLKRTQSGAGSEARHNDMVPKPEEVDVRKGSAISGKLSVVRGGTAISCDDRIAVLEERRAETEKKSLEVFLLLLLLLLFWRSQVVSEKSSQDR